MYRTKLNKSKKRNIRPGIVEALRLQPPKPDLADIGYFRPASSIARTGFGKVAAGKPNHYRTGSKHAIGSPSKVNPNIKFIHSLPKYVQGTYNG
jgi:hypothetical protein